MAYAYERTSTTEWRVLSSGHGSGHDDDASASDKAAYARSHAYSRHGQLHDDSEFDRVKIVVLGAPAVGKTAIVQQFVSGHFESHYYPTPKKETHNVSVVLHDRNYKIKLIDIPDVPFFTVNAFYSASDLQAYGLHDADAFVLVYDLLSPDSFDFVSALFHQITDSRGAISATSMAASGRAPVVVVVGAKTDKVTSSLSGSSLRAAAHGRSGRDKDHGHDARKRSGSRDKDYFGGGHHHDFGGHGGGGLMHDSHHASPFGHKSMSSHKSHGSSSSRSHHGGSGGHGHGSSNGHHHSSYSHSGSSSSGRGRKFVVAFEEDNFLEKETADKVTSDWKAIYRECSAKDNESVSKIFKTAMEELESRGGFHGTGDGHDSVPKCNIL